MAVSSRERSTSSLSFGGVLVALTGLLLLLTLLGTAASPALLMLAAISLALGGVVLTAGPGGGTGIVGTARIGRVALILFGLAPLLEMLPAGPLPPVLVGMSVLVIITVATVVAAVLVARARVLRGVARWALVVIAADAVVIAAMSSVRLGDLPFIYLGWHLELIRPMALLIWGVSIALHGRAAAIRGRGAALAEAWRRSTDVGTAQADDMADLSPAPRPERAPGPR